MNFDELSKVLKTAADKMESQEGFLTGILLKKAEVLSQEYPYDTTVIGMRNFLKRKNDSSNMVSSRELKQAYETLYSNNNKFASAFSEELGIKKQAYISKTASVTSKPEKVLSIYQDADVDMVNNLSSLFDKTKQFKSYNSKLASQAEKSTSLELSSLGFPSSKVETLTGNASLIICRASWESPKGEVSAIIPVPVVEDVVAMPSTFVSTAGITVLTSDALKSHLNDTIGKALIVDADKLLIGITKYASEQQISDVELAWLRYTKASADEDIKLDHLGVTYANPNLEQKESLASAYEYELPEETKKLSQKLYTNAGLAAMLHGKECVDNSRNYIVKSLKSMGVSAQVSVEQADNDSVVFAVNANGTHGFNVPVSIKDKVAEFPSVALANDKIVDFSKEGIVELLSEAGASSNKAMTMASPMYDLQPNEVLVRLASALKSKNFLRAEDALSVLRSLNDKFAYDAGYNMYTQALSGKLEEKTAESKCCKQIKVSSSIHPVCGHTNLPLNKVYQDKYGSCRPLHRLGREDSENVATFSSAKIIWGE